MRFRGIGARIRGVAIALASTLVLYAVLGSPASQPTSGPGDPLSAAARARSHRAHVASETLREDRDADSAPAGSRNIAIAASDLPSDEGGRASSGALPSAPRTWSNRGPIPAGVSVDSRDLRALSDFIAANHLSEASSATDFDNGDGVLEPLELGLQIWRGGRLVAFSTGPDRYQSFGYQISVVPPSVGDLDALEELDLNTNRLALLPDSIGSLSQLETLRLQRNELVALPASIASLANLRELAVGGNAIRTLPATIGSLVSLEELHANDNPLETLPDTIVLLHELRVLNVSHEPLTDPARSSGAGAAAGTSEAGLVALPPTLGEMPALQTMLVAGNRLFCAGGVVNPANIPPRLRERASVRLEGALVQRCGE